MRSPHRSPQPRSLPRSRGTASVLSRMRCIPSTGSGDTVTSQMPTSGTKITKTGGKIILYTGGESSSSNTVTVPSVVGMTVQNAIKTLQSRGINVLINGTTNYAQGEGAVVTVQGTPSGTSVKYGSVVSITCRYLSDGDDTELEIETDTEDTAQRVE